jgi:glycosyltransferase involved in cell wall biosynthesis
MRNLTYLSFDSLQEGVGASQVLSYVVMLSKHQKIRLVSFEKEDPPENLRKLIASKGIDWFPLPFGNYGAAGGINRVLRMAQKIERKSIVHARGNLAAISALIRFPRSWVWDCRSMHADQRYSYSDQTSNFIIYRVMLLIEYVLAKSSSRIVVITNAVKPEFQSRYKIEESKMVMISTCVDNEKFAMSDIPNLKELRILLSGSFSSAYDLILTNKIIKEFRRRVSTRVTVAASVGATPTWQSVDFDEYISLPHEMMPHLVAQSHFGFSILRNDLGVCLKSVATTKTAEFLSVGRPVFINSAQGDFQELFDSYDVGVITSDSDDESVKVYVDKMFSLLSSADTAEKCHQLAVENFSLEDGVSKLLGIYRELG